MEQDKKLGRNRKPEVLAPAGSMEGLKAVIAAGCDAVYMGGSRFGARAYADNADGKQLIEAIDYCHLNHVKLYLTVNTLLKNREIEEELYDFLRPAYEAGLDAVIVQDVGVLRQISRWFPELPVHASTQMALTMGKGFKELKPYHVTRIVPARELTLEELQQLRMDMDKGIDRETDRDIDSETAMEIEVFVHGALCYCYSGRCLFSSMLGGRSGNRGRCAQPCRMPYRMEGKQGGGEEYILSPKELSVLPYLDKLIEAGVDSLKIEGRMKRPEYGAFVTSIFRKYVDLYSSLGSREYSDYINKHSKEWQEDLRRLAELYNREGFTAGYLSGEAGSVAHRHPKKRGEMLAVMRPKHGGVRVGTVVSVDRHEVVYRAECAIGAQDVVEFRDGQLRTLYEYTLGKAVQKGEEVRARYQKGVRIPAGSGVYRTKDAGLLEEIRESYLKNDRQLPVKGSFQAREGKPWELSVWRDGIRVNCAGEVCQKAQKRAAAKEDVEKCLCQTGNSSFFFEELTIRLEGELFLPVGELKKLRRQALEKLEAELSEQHRRTLPPETPLPIQHRRTLPSEAPLPIQIEETPSASTIQERPSAFTQETSEIRRVGDLSVSVLHFSQLEAVLAADLPELRVIYLQTECMDREELKEAVSKIRQSGREAWVALPEVLRADVWKWLEGQCDRNGLFSVKWDGYLIKNRESLSFLQNVVQSDRAAIRLDSSMYVMNQEAVSFWREQGISRFTLPLELTAPELSELKESYGDMELPVYGRLPLMVSAQCVVANREECVFGRKQLEAGVREFADQKDRKFLTVNFCKYCYNMIYQKEPMDIRAKVGEHKLLSSVCKRLSFTLETPREVAKILGGERTGEYTMGHFERGIV